MVPPTDGLGRGRGPACQPGPRVHSTPRPGRSRWAGWGPKYEWASASASRRSIWRRSSRPSRWLRRATPTRPPSPSGCHVIDNTTSPPWDATCPFSVPPAPDRTRGVAVRPDGCPGSVRTPGWRLRTKLTQNNKERDRWSRSLSLGGNGGLPPASVRVPGQQSPRAVPAVWLDVPCTGHRSDLKESWHSNHARSSVVPPVSPRWFPLLDGVGARRTCREGCEAMT